MSTRRKDARDVIIEYFSGDSDEQRPLVIAGMMDIAKSCFEQYLKRVEKEGPREQPQPEKPKMQRATRRRRAKVERPAEKPEGPHRQIDNCVDFVELGAKAAGIAD